MGHRQVLDVADRCWARDFACQPRDLRPTATRVQEHSGDLVGASRIWILAVGPFPLVSLPPGAMGILGERARDWTRSLIADTPALREEIRPYQADKIIGPAMIGYGTSKTLALSRAAEARRLTPEDAEAVARLRVLCSDEEWDHGGSGHQEVPTFGCFNNDGDLAALAGYKTWSQEIAHISIVGAPGQRGRGLATAAVACAAQHALGAGLLPQYRTLVANAPSMGIAKRLGFVEYGFSISVRLRAV